MIQVLLDVDAKQSLLLLAERGHLLLLFVRLVLKLRFLQFVLQFLIGAFQVVDLAAKLAFERVHSLLLLGDFYLHFCHLLEAVAVQRQHQLLVIGLATVLLQDGKDFPEA